MSQEARGTAIFMAEVNALWDFVNSSTVKAPPSLRAVSFQHKEHALQQFSRFEQFVNSWKLHSVTGRTINTSLPFHKGWRLCLAAMREMFCHFVVTERTLSFMCLRKINQDHVENLHCQIRGYNGFNDHPPARDYVNALRGLACKSSTSELLDTVHPDGANCEGSSWEETASLVDCTSPDGCDSQLDVDSASSTQPAIRPILPVDCTSVSQHAANLHRPPTDSGSLELPLDTIELEISSYISGAVVHSLMRKTSSCNSCLEMCLGSTDDKSVFVQLKEFKSGCLVTVSSALHNVASDFEAFVKAEIPTALLSDHPREHLLTGFVHLHVPDNSLFSCCPDHEGKVLHDFFVAYCNIRIFHEVKELNKKLRGSKKGNEFSKMKKLNL